jgi:hypothetical protein
VRRESAEIASDPAERSGAPIVNYPIDWTS